MVTVVFGATGNVGRHVAVGLSAAGERIRLTSRNPHSANLPAGADVVAADLEDPATLPAALEGARRVFLYAKPEGIDGFVTAAEAAGVQQVVLLSSGSVVHPDAARNPIAQAHAAVEAALENSSLASTFIRAGMFATNTLWWWRNSIRDESTVRVPFPDAHTAPVHERDLAALAVTALTSPGHGGRAYSVWGAESLTIRNQVRHIGAAIGREISVEEISVDQARAELGQTMPPIGVDAILAAWRAGTTGPQATSTVIADVTGRPAHTFARWAQDHAHDFR